LLKSLKLTFRSNPQTTEFGRLQTAGFNLI